MNETFILILKIVGIYLLGMGIAYVIAAKVIGYDNMTSEDELAVSIIIAFSWIGIAVTILVVIVYCLKLLLDFIFKIKQNDL